MMLNVIISVLSLWLSHPRASPQVSSGPENLRLHEIASRKDFTEWATSFFVALYDGTEVSLCVCVCVPGRLGYMLLRNRRAGHSLSSFLS